MRKNSEDFSREAFIEALPRNHRKNFTVKQHESLIRRIKESDLGEAISENFFCFASALNGDRGYSIRRYIDAVIYVTNRLVGAEIKQAYYATFPERYKEYKNKKNKLCSERAIYAYNNSKIVCDITSIAMIPSYIVNAPIYQEAINKKVELMRSAKSERIQLEAAIALTSDLKPPESKKIEIDIGIKQNSLLKDLQEATLKLAKKQQELIESKVISAKDVAHERLIISHNEIEDAEFKES